MPEPRSRPGFRCSSTDVLVLVSGAVIAIGLAALDGWLGVAAAYVVAHFFLFCNVVRLPRPLELTWGAAFVVLCLLATNGWLSWLLAFALSFVLTLALVGIQMRRPSYCGVGWRRVNPQLPEWPQPRLSGEAASPRRRRSSTGC